MSSDRNIAYVASGQIPPSAPPAATTGFIGWIKENLFDGIVNSILTLASIAIIVLLVPPIIDWAFLKSVWNADSLSDCREVIAATHGEHVEGGCWAVINERLNQFLFGFYPSELYWRPSLAFMLLFVALAPILFNQLPRQMLWFSAAFPAVAYFLIWGGSIWGVLAVLGGPVVGVLLGFRVGRLLYGDNFVVAAIVSVLLSILWWLFLIDPIEDGLISVIGFVGFEPVESAKIGGFLLAVIIGVTGIAASLPIGVLLALGRQSSMFAIKTMCVVFIEFIRGVPLITLLFVASVLLAYFLPPGTNFDLILRVCIMVTLFSSAYMAEVIRGGLAALSSGQYEAADALGLDYWKSTRLIIIAEDLYPRDRQQLHRALQGHHTGVGHRASRSRRPFEPDPRGLELERNPLGALRLRGAVLLGLLLLDVPLFNVSRAQAQDRSLRRLITCQTK
jgi:general L-amino acid transport system permease protein